MSLSSERRAELEIDATAAWIRSHGFARVALQLPDGMLREAAAISEAISGAVDRGAGGHSESPESPSTSVFVMADCIDGSCHVDEITAQHLGADCVVHFGADFIHASASVPVRFVLAQAHLDEPSTADAIVEVAASNPGAAVVVAFELRYAHAMPAVAKRVSEADGAAGVTFARVLMRVQSDPKAIGGEAEPSSSTSGGLAWPEFPDPAPPTTVVVWIGGEGLALTHCMLLRAHDATATWRRLDPAAEAAAGAGPRPVATMDALEGEVSRALRRRYYLASRARAASVVGVVVGSVSIAGYLDAADALCAMAAAAGKTCYTFVMGRITPEKLANYPEVECFVLVSAPQLALVDPKQQGFMQPIITPYEATLAFARADADADGDAFAWEGRYEAGFGAVWRAKAAMAAEGVGEGEGGGGEDEGVGGGPGLAVAAVHTGRGLAPVSSAAEYLVHRRTYDGIQTPASGAEVKEAAAFVEGRAGRAAGYRTDAAKEGRQ